MIYHTQSGKSNNFSGSVKPRIHVVIFLTIVKDEYKNTFYKNNKRQKWNINNSNPVLIKGRKEEKRPQNIKEYLGTF